MTDELDQVGFGSNDDVMHFFNKEGVITYSNAIDIVVSPMCRNQCGYCAFAKNEDKLIVPYSTIKKFKNARHLGAREANIIAGERPDTFSVVRAKFDVWGFNNYVEYLYTIAELAFLEGLLVNLNVGYLSFNELKYLQDIVASVECMIETTNPSMNEGLQHQYSPSKSPAVRLKFLEHCGRLNFPANTGIIVGMGESPEDRINAISSVCNLHEEYRHIQSFKINPFIAYENTAMSSFPSADSETVLETVRLAREILPAEVDVCVPVNLFPDVKALIQNGVTDFGQIRLAGVDGNFPEKAFQPMEYYESVVHEMGKELGKRLPIKNSLVYAQKYSKKLGQFLDKYKQRLKEAQAEKEFELVMEFEDEDEDIL